MSRRRPRARQRARRSAGGSGDTRALGSESLLRTALFCALGLLLLTPFVLSPGTVYPFMVGKALWSRSLIEIAFALWAVLALTHRGYRPPRSWLLLLLGAGLAVSLLSAWCGVSPQRSLWSSYERMQGVLDQAHWAALALVLVWVLRTPREWRVLLAGSAAAGAAMACLVIARALDIDVPFFSEAPEPHLPRLGGPAGNPTFLAVYMLANLVLAAGFAARALTPEPGVGVDARRRLAATGWASVVALDLAALALTGSVGGSRRPLRGGRVRRPRIRVARARAPPARRDRAARGARGRRRAARRALLRCPTHADGLDVGSPRPSGPTSPGRCAAWAGSIFSARACRADSRSGGQDSRASPSARCSAGVPENFGAVFGRFADGYAATAEPHDNAHGKAVEVAATSGLAGLAVWLAVCGLALAVPIRAVRAMAPPERTLTVFAAAAIAGHLVQIQFLFDVAVGNLVGTILIAFAARLETSALPLGLVAAAAGGAPRGTLPVASRAP